MCCPTSISPCSSSHPFGAKAMNRPWQAQRQRGAAPIAIRAQLARGGARTTSSSRLPGRNREQFEHLLAFV